MSVLPHQEILALCGLAPGDPDETVTDIGPIRPCLKRNIRSAGYDLRLGEEYYLQEKPRWGRLETRRLVPNRATTLVIPPNQVVIVTTVERLRISDDMVGHMSLKLDLLLKGLMMANQSQIDAGYEGELFCLLYNLTNHEVCLQLHEPIVRLELVRLSQPTTKPYSDKYKNIKLSQALRSRVESSLYAIRRDVDNFQKNLRLTQIIATILFIATSVFTYFGPLTNRLTKLEQQASDAVEIRKLESSLGGESGVKELASLQQEVKELKARVALLTEQRTNQLLNRGKNSGKRE